MIVNWLITRKCNRRCSYCGIIHNPKNPNFKKISDINKNEQGFEDIKASIKGMNLVYGFENLFHIFYGGEPFLKPGFSDFLKWCNDPKNDVLYTVITNASMKETILDVCQEIGGYKGLTVSLDPLVIEESNDLNNVKNNNALEILRLNKSFKLTDDMVVECVLDKKNIKHAIPFLDMMAKEFPKVTISLSVYDYPKNQDYDFALNDTATDQYMAEMRLSPNDPDVKETFKMIINGINRSKYKIHLGSSESFIKKIQDTVDSSYFCDLYYKPIPVDGPVQFKTLTIDADGEFRMCLRVAGECKTKVVDVFGHSTKETINFNTHALANLLDKSYTKMCKGCAWTCPMMDEWWTELSDVSHGQR